jgi:hypothetical protein
MDINNLRKKNLRQLIEVRFSGSVKAFADFMKKNHNTYYAVLRTDRNFGERLARDIETTLNLELGTLDKQQNQDSYQELASIPIYSTNIIISKHTIHDEIPLDYYEIHKKYIIEYGWNIDKLCIFKMQNDSMSPTIQEGSRIIVDTSVASNITDNKIYAICINNEVFIKRLFRDLETNGTLIRSDNKAYDDVILKNADKFQIIGRAVYILGVKL